jgi:ABC-2 type transport system permease protein
MLQAWAPESVISTVSYLGQPDHGVILASYIGSFLMAGGFLAIGACLSALTKNQVIAFVLTAAACFAFTVSGSPIVLGMLQAWAPESVISTVSSFSFLTHFNAIIKGVIDLRDAVFFASVIGVFLLANVVLVDLKKAD